MLFPVSRIQKIFHLIPLQIIVKKGLSKKRSERGIVGEVIFVFKLNLVFNLQMEN